MEPDAVPPAHAALAQARELAKKASAQERAYIEAPGTCYEAAAGADQTALNAAYARAMGEVRRAHPQDLDAAVLYADAVMSTMAWDPSKVQLPLTIR